MGNMTFSKRLRKIAELGEALKANQEKMARQAAREIKFTLKDSRREVLTTIQRLGMYEGARSKLEGRKPLGGEGSTVALMLSYNGSAWLNIAITSIFAVGNRVLVKFSSKGSELSKLTESIYKPIFGNHVQFTRIGGHQFMESSLKDPNISSIVVFGSDATVLPYEEAVRKSGKKLIFEGPGQDPFIVFPDADIELALSDLMVSKFLNNGQACIAAKRIFIHRSIYDSFLREFRGRTGRLVVGDPKNEKTDISPVISDLAVNRIKLQLEEAVEKSAQIVLGGRIEGNLIYPTIVRDATDDMLGMREEVFGPVAFTTPFDNMEEVIRRAKDNQYGLRAAVFGGKEAAETAQALIGEEYCHPVPSYTFGKFGTVALNETRSESWIGAFIAKAVGGYGYSGWIWETVDGKFQIKQGPKLLSLETSRA
jgi:acyl-CoA reductase-like NAD-dependent aldehyde dehydrogenase